MDTPLKLSPEQQRYLDLALEIRDKFYDDMLGAALFLFPWGEPGPLENFRGPRPKQARFLEDLSDEIRARKFDGIKPVLPIRMSISSGHGEGKSSMLGMLATILMATRDGLLGTVTANTGQQLATKTWAAIWTWHKYSIVKPLFEINAEKFYRIGRKNDWFMSAQSCAEENSEAFAGQHNVKSSSVYFFDEDSNVPDKIHEVAEGGLTDGEPMIFRFGNCTRRDSGKAGTFFDINFGNKRDFWNRATLGPSRATETPAGTRVWDAHGSPFANQDQQREWLQEYGFDSDFYRVRVRGLAPNQGDTQFISAELIAEAQRRMPACLADDALVAGVDYAWGGCFDDQTEILTNEGWKLFQHLYSNEKVLTLDGDTARWGDITAIHKYWHDGPMNLLERRSQNFCITDNHNLLVRGSAKLPKYSIKRYDALAGNFLIRGTNSWEGTSPEAVSFTTLKRQHNGGNRTFKQEFYALDFAEFLGWFVAEGNVYWTKPTKKYPEPRPSIEISQRNLAKRRQIESLLRRLGFTATYWSKHGTIRVSGKNLAHWLDRHCGVKAANKRVPRWVMDGSPEIIRAFLESFRAGDGTEKKDGNGRSYSTSSERLADDIQECLAKLGCAGKKSRIRAAGSETVIEGRRMVRNHDQWTVYERRAPSDCMIFKRHVRRIDYSGWIWCVSTPLKTICVRRGGVVMWSGNSDQNTVRFRCGLDARTIPAIHVPGEQTKTPEPMILRLSQVLMTEYLCADGKKRKVSMLFMDSAGICSRVAQGLRDLGFGSRIREVNFGAHSIDPHYELMRSFMWGTMRDWLIAGGVIDKSPDLEADLGAPGYKMVSHKGDPYTRLLLEKKELIIKRIGHSTDDGDGLCLTFAAPVATQAAENAKKAVQQSQRAPMPKIGAWS